MNRGDGVSGRYLSQNAPESKILVYLGVYANGLVAL